MTKTDLAFKLAEANPHLRRHELEAVVDAIIGEIVAALSRGDRVELRGFGSFSVKRYDARLALNPRTGERINLAQRHLPAFKTGRLLRNRLNA